VAVQNFELELDTILRIYNNGLRRLIWQSVKKIEYFFIFMKTKYSTGQMIFRFRNQQLTVIAYVSLFIKDKNRQLDALAWMLLHTDYNRFDFFICSPS